MIWRKIAINLYCYCEWWLTNALLQCEFCFMIIILHVIFILYCMLCCLLSCLCSRRTIINWNGRSHLKKKTPCDSPFCSFIHTSNVWEYLGANPWNTETRSPFNLTDTHDNRLISIVVLSTPNGIASTGAMILNVSIQTNKKKSRKKGIWKGTLMRIYFWRNNAVVRFFNSIIVFWTKKIISYLHFFSFLPWNSPKGSNNSWFLFADILYITSFWIYFDGSTITGDNAPWISKKTWRAQKKFISNIHFYLFLILFVSRLRFFSFLYIFFFSFFVHRSSDGPQTDSNVCPFGRLLRYTFWLIKLHNFHRLY